MSVTLNWGSANAALAESIKVYRTTTPMDVNNLPAALATIAGSATSYTDTTAVRNTLYYYAVGHVRGGNELVSPVFIMGHYPDTGPGPQTLLRGDWNLGYFGTCTPLQMFSPSTLNAQIPIPGALATDASITVWHKFIRKGKVLFIPNAQFSINANFGQLYNAGLAMGTNDNGNFPFTIASSNVSGYTVPVNQYRVATVGAYQFITRSIKISDKPTTSYINPAVDMFPSEWNDLMGRMGQTLLAGSPQDKWNDLPVPYNSWLSNTQNFTALNTACYIYANTGHDFTGAAPTNSAQGWVPVLELILT